MEIIGRDREVTQKGGYDIITDTIRSKTADSLSDIGSIIYADVTDELSRFGIDFYKTPEGLKTIRRFAMISKDISELAKLMRLTEEDLANLADEEPVIADIIKDTGSFLEVAITSLLVDSLINREERTVKIQKELDPVSGCMVEVRRMEEIVERPVDLNIISKLESRLGLDTLRGNVSSSIRGSDTELLRNTSSSDLEAILKLVEQDNDKKQG